MSESKGWARVTSHLRYIKPAELIAGVSSHELWLCPRGHALAVHDGASGRAMGGVFECFDCHQPYAVLPVEGPSDG